MTFFMWRAIGMACPPLDDRLLPWRFQTTDTRCMTWLEAREWKYTVKSKTSTAWNNFFLVFLFIWNSFCYWRDSEFRNQSANKQGHSLLEWLLCCYMYLLWWLHLKPWTPRPAVLWWYTVYSRNTLYVQRIRMVWDRTHTDFNPYNPIKGMGLC